MNKWHKYLAEARKNQEISNEPYQKKVRRGYVKDRNKYTQTGPQKKGGAPYNRKPPNTRAKSAPPGFGAIGEEVEPESFEKQTTLDPQFWVNDQLKPKVAKRLSKIAVEFIKGLDIKGAQDFEDIRLTGSIANYNWSKYSDIDLHIVVDFSKIDENTELVKSFFDNARMRWNDLHDITIYGAEVEIYVENVGDIHKSSGIYSLTDEKWIVEPSPEIIEFDYLTARKKADSLQTQVNLIDKFAQQKPRAALKSIERLKDKIRRTRRAGLNSPEQEYSAENIAFKILRREETLDKLNDLKYDVYDRILSIGE